jgi:hypothetical protein
MQVTPQSGGALPSPVPHAGGPVPPPDDLAGFAQEFLRRNPIYRREWLHLKRGGDSQSSQTQTSYEEMARHWGLCFSL